MGMLKTDRSGTSWSRNPELQRRWPASIIDRGKVMLTNEQ